MRTRTRGAKAVSAYAHVVVGLRWPIAVAWIVAAALAWAFLPSLGGSSGAPLGDIVPADSRALATEARAVELFGSAIATDTVIVQRNPRGLARAEAEAHARAAQRTAQRQLPRELAGIRAAVPLVNASLGGVRWNERDTTALTYLFMSEDLNLLERDAAVRRYADTYLRPAAGTTTGVTGAGPARLGQYEEIEDVLPWIELATVAVIVVIVALYFRSLGAPLVTLVTAAVAYVLATRALAWSGEQASVTVPSEIEPILVVLLLGLVTDYTIFFMSETRRRLARGEPRVRAARRAAERIAPIVMAAGVLVAGGAVSLLAGRLEFFRVFGPGLAMSALIVTVVCVSFVPATLALVGPWVFGKRVREAEPERSSPPAATVLAGQAVDSVRREKWRLRMAGPLGAMRAARTHAREEGRHWLPGLGARALTAWPVAFLMVVLCAGVLAVAAAGARDSRLEVAFVSSLPPDSEPRQAADDAGRGFVPGILAPTDVVLEQPGIGARRDALVRLQELVERRPGVAVAIGPREQARPALPDLAVSRGGGAARIAIVLDGEPTGARAIDAFRSLRDDMPALLRSAGLSSAQVSYGGETALAAETVDSIKSDLARIAAVALAMTFVLLALFLRALVAPVLLLSASVLAFLGSYGLTALIMPSLLDGDDFVYYVPLVAAVLLVALGSDYNVFIAGRIRAEARRRRLREAIAIAAPAASRAITVAGITLAATFALLALVPLRPFRELGLLMSIGVLIDALLVRPLLIPCLIAVFGRLTWWPGRVVQPPEADAFVERVAARSGQDSDDARDATLATLGVLACRLPGAQARELARHLPEELRAPFEDRSNAEPFSADEFVARVAARTSTSRSSARSDVVAVFGTLREALPATELDYVRAALSEDYRPLLGDGVAPERFTRDDVGAAAVRAG